MTPVPAELRSTIFTALVRVLHEVGHVGGLSGFQRAKVLRDIETLRKDDAANAFLLDSIVAFSDGRFDDAETLALKAAKLNLVRESDITRAYHRLNVGRFTDGVALLKQHIYFGATDVSRPLNAALTACAFDLIVNFVDTLPAGQLLSADANEVIATARAGQQALKEAGVEEIQLRAVMELAGELLQREKLFWLDPRPQIRIFSSADGADSFSGVHVHFRIATSAGQAAGLNRELSWLAVDRDLVHPGASASFVGIRAAAVA